MRIFEPRYLDMVSNCLKNNLGIGVILIKDGSEVGAAAEIHDIGTLTHISYWNRRKDGLLGITLRGEQRFRVVSQQVEPSQLIIAEVEMLPSDNAAGIAEEYQHLVALLQQIINQLEPPYTTMPTHFDDAGWVSARLVELLPISLTEKQNFLLIQDPYERLEQLNRRLDEKVFI